MDRSFLSQREVIAASRDFVCVRLTTYEDEAELAFMKNITPTRSGEVENTTFTILSSDGKKQLIRGSRQPRGVFSDAEAMATAMKKIAAENKPSHPPKGYPVLPKVRTVRMAVNVASSDNLPLALVYTKDAATLEKLERRLAELAWNDKFIGHFTWGTTADLKECSIIKGIPDEGGLIIVQPDQFGLAGEVLAQAGPDATSEKLAETLSNGLKKYQSREKTFRDHVREGHQKGILWETRLPVTDPMEARARERGQQKKE